MWIFNFKYSVRNFIVNEGHLEKLRYDYVEVNRTLPFFMLFKNISINIIILIFLI